MNSPPSSLAQLIYPAAPAAGEDTAPDPILMNYLQNYPPESHEEHAARFLPNGDYRKDELLAPPSPIDTSVPIPPALAELAALPSTAPFLVSLPPPLPQDDLQSADRGEMGGKRRKAPHERAGWKEMLEEEATGQRPTSSVGRKRSRGYEIDNYNSLGMRGMDGVEDVAEEQGEDEPVKRGKMSKELRAEQNRKAQQIFRRKREEKIKQLEADSLALAGTRQRLATVEARLLDLAMELEAKTIEASGLRRALLTVVSCVDTSVTRPDGMLALTPADWEARDKSKFAAAHAEQSCVLLSKAARELAKSNRQQRLEAAQAQVAAQAQAQLDSEQV